MKKIYGTNKRQDGLVQSGRNRWTLFYGYGEDNGCGWEWREEFDHKPGIEEIKNCIISQVNKNTDQKILSGMVWKDMPVWLSQENQFNYKACHDMALQSNGATLPVKFKFGTDDIPIYYEFKTIEDIVEFYTNCVIWIQQCINEGWEEKDSVNWDVFV